MWALKDEVYISVSSKRLNLGLFVKVRFTETLTTRITSDLPSQVPSAALHGVLVTAQDDCPSEASHSITAQIHQCSYCTSCRHSDLYLMSIWFTAPLTLGICMDNADYRGHVFHSGQLTKTCSQRRGKKN